MKKLISYGIIAAMVLSGCQKGDDSVNHRRNVKFYATVEASSTKTSLDPQCNVQWRQGDQVSIFNGSTINEKWQIEDQYDRKYDGELYNIDFEGFVAGGVISNNVAYYPYATTNTIALAQKASDTSISDGSIYRIGNITLPATQNYTAGSFENGVFPMVAVTASASDNELVFKNVLGAIKLQLKGSGTITSISICGNNNEILCGAASVTASNGTTPTIALTDANAKTVTLDCGAGVALSSDTATPFIIALPPVTMEGGFTVTVSDSDGHTMELKTTLSQTIKRSGMLKMPAVEYAGE